MVKSVVEKLECKAPELFASARATVFRRWDLPSLITDLVPRWMATEGIARLEVFDSLYISTGLDEAVAQFDELKEQFGSLPFFCLNDSCDDAPDDDERLIRVRQVLQELLNEPSQYEATAEGVKLSGQAPGELRATLCVPQVFG
jgi:hypothetical protein